MIDIKRALCANEHLQLYSLKKLASGIGIKYRDKWLHLTDTVGCNYLSLSLRLTSATALFIQFRYNATQYNIILYVAPLSICEREISIVLQSIAIVFEILMTNFLSFIRVLALWYHPPTVSVTVAHNREKRIWYIYMYVYFWKAWKFEMLTVRGQQHSFSTHERMFLGQCQSFWDRKCLGLSGGGPPDSCRML